MAAPSTPVEKKGKAGRPSDLTEELTLKIRKFVLRGMPYIDIQEELHILPTTWDQWVYKNYKDFRDLLTAWKRERLIRMAEDFSGELMEMPHRKLRIFTKKIGKGKGAEIIEQTVEEVNTEVLRVKQKESEFLRETLAKSDYSKRSEVTGKDGEKLMAIEKVAEDTRAILSKPKKK